MTEETNITHILARLVIPCATSDDSMTEETNITHIYHHQDHVIRVSVKAERNTKGWNYEASVSDAASPEEALEVLKRTTDSLARVYSTPAPAPAQPQG